MKKLFLALLLSLTGCFLPARDPTVTMHGDSSFLPQERECLQDSANKWSEQTSGLVDIKLDWDYDAKDPVSVVKHLPTNRLERWTSTTPEVQMYNDEGLIVLGLVKGKGIKDEFRRPIRMYMVMDRLQDPHDCRLTGIHEFGHVLGLPHIEGPGMEGAIMYPYTIHERSACLKKEDLMLFCFVNDCGKVQMKPCEDDHLPSLFPEHVPGDGETFGPFVRM